MNWLIILVQHAAAGKNISYYSCDLPLWEADLLTTSSEYKLGPGKNAILAGAYWSDYEMVDWAANILALLALADSWSAFIQLAAPITLICESIIEVRFT